MHKSSLSPLFLTIIKYLLIIFFIEYINFYLIEESWIPTVEKILRLFLFVSQFYVVYLIYKIIKILHKIFKKRYSKKRMIIYTLLVSLCFTASFVFVNFLYFLGIAFSPKLITKNVISNRVFYIYYYPIKGRDKLIYTSKYFIKRELVTSLRDNNIFFYQKGDKVILKTSKKDIELYDLSTSSIVCNGG